jgi:hypothetical protein
MLPASFGESIDCMVKAKDCDQLQLQLHLCLDLIDVDFELLGLTRPGGGSKAFGFWQLSH